MVHGARPRGLKTELRDFGTGSSAGLRGFSDGLRGFCVRLREQSTRAVYGSSLWEQSTAVYGSSLREQSTRAVYGSSLREQMILERSLSARVFHSYPTVLPDSAGCRL